VFLALPLEAHRTMLSVLKEVGRTVADVRVVPDLLQYITFRAGVEDMDGLPVVHLTQVPLTGWMSLVKRTLDVAISAAALVVLSPLLRGHRRRDPPLRRRTGALPPAPHGPRRAPVRHPEVPLDARRRRGGRRGRRGRSRTTRDARASAASCAVVARRAAAALERAARRDVARRPAARAAEFVGEFKEKFPQYMVRHRVRAGITGWAQVHGWRGNTSLSKRIEYDLYYIENWSLSLDFRILWMTLRHGLRHRNAY
jgi:hypothetical protein